MAPERACSECHGGLVRDSCLFCGANLCDSCGLMDDEDRLACMECWDGGRYEDEAVTFCEPGESPEKRAPRGSYQPHTRETGGGRWVNGPRHAE